MYYSGITRTLGGSIFVGLFNLHPQINIPNKSSKTVFIQYTYKSMMLHQKNL